MRAATLVKRQKECSGSGVWPQTYATSCFRHSWGSAQRLCLPESDRLSLCQTSTVRCSCAYERTPSRNSLNHQGNLCWNRALKKGTGLLASPTKLLLTIHPPTPLARFASVQLRPPPHYETQVKGLLLRQTKGDPAHRHDWEMDSKIL